MYSFPSDTWAASHNNMVTFTGQEVTGPEWWQYVAPFDQPFIMSLTQALGIDSNAFDPNTTPLPATTQIDWVRVWS